MSVSGSATEKIMNIIEVDKLSRKFGGLTAVDGISFDVGKGEIFGFLGPNGAGKSTTINMLATLLTPSGGDAKINGYSILTHRDDVRRSIGLVFQDPSLDERLTAEENLHFHSRLYGVTEKDFTQRAPEVLRLVDLWDRKNDIAGNFSGGMKRRLEIARGLIHYPAVLFLDEPTLGLDPQTRSHLWEYILRLKNEKEMTIFMTTHYMNEAEYCDRIAIIDRGAIIALDSPAGLKKLVGGDIVSVQCKDKELLKLELENLPNMSVKEDNDTLQIEVEDGASFLPDLLHKTKIRIDTVELRRPTLEDVFLKLTGRKIRDEGISGREKLKQQVRLRRRR